MTGLTDIMREIFDDSKVITLKQIYDIISKHPDVNLEPHVLPLRVRTTINYMIKNHEIKRIEKATYKKMSNV